MRGTEAARQRGTEAARRRGIKGARHRGGERLGGVPEDAVVADTVESLRFYVDRDRQALGDRRRASETLRQGRLMLGFHLNQARKRLTDHGFGRVLRGLGLHRHTAYHAMRLAAEFTREDGALDAEKVLAVRTRNAGVLKTTRAGQRLLETRPEDMSLKDLRRLLGIGGDAARPGTDNRTDSTECVDPGQHTGPEGTVRGDAARTEAERQDDDSALSLPPTLPLPAPAPAAATAGAGGLRRRAADGPESPIGSPSPEGRGVAVGVGVGVGVGVQLELDFEAAERLSSGLDRVIKRMQAGLLDDPESRGELAELVAEWGGRIDRLLHRGRA